MRNRIAQALFFTLHFSLFTLCLTSCQYKDLCYDHTHGTDYDLILQLHFVIDTDYDFPVDEETHTKIDIPEYTKANFYNPESGTLNRSEFVKGDRGPIYISPGTYDMVAYSFGTEWTQVRGEGDINTLEAFTSDITRQKASALSRFTRGGESEAPGPIIYTPDHLLVVRKQVEIPKQVESGIYVIDAEMRTIIETYDFSIHNITGIQYIQSIEAFVTNQARSNFFGRGEMNTEPATIYFPIEVKPNTIGISTAFNTFGKLPGESRAFLHILITSTGGEEIQISEDITDEFIDPDHHIDIKTPIDVPKPEGGAGIAPTVEQWEEERTDVPIG